MAVLKITDRQVTVSLDWWEKLAARRSNFTIPTRAITGVSVVEDACSTAMAVPSGRRAPGTRIRGVTNTGTFMAADGTGASTFAVCHGKGRGIILELKSATVTRIIISTPNAEDYARELSLLVG
ncbi:hypothetical protein [Corynebacterium comes]|uniref:Uncharacterized protein n=1 Tax=Corynebacterium comes TaxID=2675218 RepID=A0A6B8VXE2_9CORY|nr:hypothetical protein [Corynebacterium comes]QGU03665.1 hypothetical protein CETAM_01905 [Corynebacterium comes]